MLEGLDHVQLAMPAGGEAVARAFYEALGLTEIAKPDSLRARGGCWFAGPGFELHLGVEQDFRPARKAHPAFLVDDADAAYARLKQLSYEPPQWDTALPGVRRFYAHDPFGNRLEFLQADAPEEVASKV